MLVSLAEFIRWAMFSEQKPHSAIQNTIYRNIRTKLAVFVPYADKKVYSMRKLL